MNSEEQLLQEIYRLKNQISDLKNALDLNRDFLKIVINKEHNKETKVDLLYKIIYRLTNQSNDALIRNAELLHQKNQLKMELSKVSRQLEDVQSRLQGQIKRNNFLENPTLSKIAMQEQFSSLNNELFASHQQKIHLQYEIQQWKSQYYQLQETIAQKLRELKGEKEVDSAEREQIEDFYEEVPLKKSKLSRKYTCNKVIEQDQKRTKLQKENRLLKYYIEELEQRIMLFIKAYNLEENIVQRRKTSTYSKNKSILQSADHIQINLIKYAINEIALEERQNQLYMRIKKTFVDNQDNLDTRRDRRNVHSYPKHKQYLLSEETSDSAECKIRTYFLSESSR